jgi:hypothetical protein
MKKNPEDFEEIDQETLPPETPDFYSPLRQRDNFILKKIETLESKVAEIYCIVSGKEYTVPTQPHYESQFNESSLKKSTKVKKVEDVRPSWLKERDTEEPKEIKKKPSRKRLYLIIITVLLFLFALFLRGQGWSCVIPGI